MTAVVQFQPDWPKTTFRLTIPLTVKHTMRVLLKAGGRLVECAPQEIYYRAGDITFTIHYFIDGDTAFNMFADHAGWALQDEAVMRLIQEGIIFSEFD